MLFLSLLASLSWAPSAAAFYLPGAAPRDYVLGEKVPVHVNRLNPLVGAQDARLVSGIVLGTHLLNVSFTAPWKFGDSCALG